MSSRLDADGADQASTLPRLAALVKRVAESRIQIIIDRLVGFTSSKDEGVRDIASLGACPPSDPARG